MLELHVPWLFELRKSFAHSRACYTSLLRLNALKDLIQKCLSKYFSSGHSLSPRVTIMNWEWLSCSSLSGVRAKELGCARRAASMDLVGEGLAVAVEGIEGLDRRPMALQRWASFPHGSLRAARRAVFGRERPISPCVSLGQARVIAWPA